MKSNKLSLLFSMLGCLSLILFACSKQTNIDSENTVAKKPPYIENKIFPQDFNFYTLGKTKTGIKNTDASTEISDKLIYAYKEITEGKSIVELKYEFIDGELYIEDITNGHLEVTEKKDSNGEVIYTVKKIDADSRKKRDIQDSKWTSSETCFSEKCVGNFQKNVLKSCGGCAIFKIDRSAFKAEVYGKCCPSGPKGGMALPLVPAHMPK